MNPIQRPRVIIITLIVFALLLVAFSGALEQQSAQYNQNSLVQTTTLYGITRGLNAAISSLQGTTINLPLVSFSVGQVLDPMNDLIERFSWIVLMAVTSLGIQKMLLAIESAWLMDALLLVSGGAFIASLWCQQGAGFKGFIQKLFCIVLVVRFAMTFSVLTNMALDHFYFKDSVAKATVELQRTTEEIKQTQQQTSAALQQAQSSADEDFIDRFERKVSEQWQGLTNKVKGARHKLDDLNHSVERSIDSVIDLIIYFVVKSVLLPVLMLWLFYKGLLMLIKMPLMSAKKQQIIHS